MTASAVTGGATAPLRDAAASRNPSRASRVGQGIRCLLAALKPLLHRNGAAKPRSPSGPSIAGADRLAERSALPPDSGQFRCSADDARLMPSNCRKQVQQDANRASTPCAVHELGEPAVEASRLPPDQGDHPAGPIRLRPLDPPAASNAVARLPKPRYN